MWAHSSPHFWSEKGGCVQSYRRGQGIRSCYYTVAHPRLQGQPLSLWADILSKWAIFISSGSSFSAWSRVPYILYSGDTYEFQLPIMHSDTLFHGHTSPSPAPMPLSSFLIPNLQSYLLFHILLYSWDFPCPVPTAPHWWHPCFIDRSTNNKSPELFPQTTRRLLAKSMDLHKINGAWSLGSELRFIHIQVYWRPVSNFVWLEPRLRESQRGGRNDEQRAWWWRALYVLIQGPYPWKCRMSVSEQLCIS